MPPGTASVAPLFTPYRPTRTWQDLPCTSAGEPRTPVYRRAISVQLAPATSGLSRSLADTPTRRSGHVEGRSRTDSQADSAGSIPGTRSKQQGATLTRARTQNPYLPGHERSARVHPRGLHRRPRCHRRSPRPLPHRLPSRLRPRGTLTDPVRTAHHRIVLGRDPPPPATSCSAPAKATGSKDSR